MYTQLPKQQIIETEASDYAMNTVRKLMYNDGMFLKTFKIVPGAPIAPEFAGIWKAEPRAIMLFERTVSRGKLKKFTLRGMKPFRKSLEQIIIERRRTAAIEALKGRADWEERLRKVYRHLGEAEVQYIIDIYKKYNS